MGDRAVGSREESPFRSGERMVYTLGTSTRSLEDFLSLLLSRGVSRVCDVRAFPVSRRYPQFSRDELSSFLRERGLDYRWLGELLGGYRRGGYLAYTETPDFQRGIEELERLAEEASTAIVCAELLPWKCHRRYISAALEQRGWRVVHILDAQRDWVPAAKGGQLILPGDGRRGSDPGGRLRETRRGNPR